MMFQLLTQVELLRGVRRCAARVEHGQQSADTCFEGKYREVLVNSYNPDTRFDLGSDLVLGSVVPCNDHAPWTASDSHQT